MLSPTPALPALAVEVAAVEIVNDDYREVLDEKAVDRFSPKIIAYDDLGAEAVHRLFVEEFPVVVVNDLYGGDLYREGRERWRR